MKSEVSTLQTDFEDKTTFSNSGRLHRFYQRADKGLLVLVLFFVLSLPLFTPRIYASDEIKYFSYLHSIFFDHDVNFTNEYTYFYNTDPQKYEFFKASVLDKRNEIGLPPNEGPVGSALMWSPFYLAAHGAAYLGQEAGLKNFKPDGYSTPYVWAVSLASLIYGFLGLLFSYLLVRSFVPRFYAALATVAIWFASPVVFYMSLTPPMSHANSLFVISLWLYIWYKTRGWSFDDAGNFVPGLRSGPKWLLLGVLGGLVTMVREQDGTILIVAAIESIFLYYQFLKSRNQASTAVNEFPTGRSHESEVLETQSEYFNQVGEVGKFNLNKIAALFSGNVQLLIGLFLGIIPQLLIYLALNGHPGPSKIVGDKLGFLNPAVFFHFLGLLFDPNHGMFFWSPILLPSALGLFLMLRERRLRIVGIGLLAAYFCELYVSASFQTWTMSGSFGARRFVGISPAFIAGLAYLGYLIADAKSGWQLKKKWLSGLVVLFIAWNFGLIIQFSAIRTEKDRQELNFTRVVVDQFTAVPGKILTISRDFIFNRSKFYKK